MVFVSIKIGLIYIGSYVNGLKHGYGVMKYDDGRAYEG